MNATARIGAIVLASAIFIVPNSVVAGIKCWTNHEGVKECGNVVPPEFAQQGHEELSEQGITVKKQDRAKTAEEIAAEKEAKRQQKEREKLAKEQAIKDQNLLDTFTTEEDLILARDGKLQVIDTRIAHQERITDDLHSDLEMLEKQAADQERSGESVSDDLLASIASVQRKIDESKVFIVERRQERIALEERFNSDLARYRQLKGN